jgi:hypothetical protein
MGCTVQITRGQLECIEKIPFIAPEQKVFHEYDGTTGIMAHFEENEEILSKKEKDETLTEDEQALVKMVHYIKNFKPDKWPILSYEYWMDYRYKLSKDKRLQMLLQGSIEYAEDGLDRSHRFEVAMAEGDKVDENIGILHSATVPEFRHTSFYAFAKPLFRLFQLLGLSANNFDTGSIMIKLHSVEVAKTLKECRVLLGPSAWNGNDLPANPTYQQLMRFLTAMMHVLVDGTLEVTSTKRKASGKQVEVNHNGTKSGKTTRRRREKIMEYKLKFEYPDKTMSEPYTALERVAHLTDIIKED